MGWVSGTVVYILIWWTVIFCVLPFGLRRDETGKPEVPHLGRKALMTTGIAFVIWLAVYVIIESGLISFRNMAAHAAEIPPYCRLLPQHKPEAGVEYVPGVDVHGRPVVPADLNSSINVVEKDIVIPIEVDLAEHFGRVFPGGVELKPGVGAMTIHPDGRVSYGEQDITPEAYVLCGTAPPVDLTKPAAAPAVTPSQPAADAVPSMPQPGEVIEGQYP